MDDAKVYSELKERVASLNAQFQLWSGRKEAHEASKKALLAEAAQLGIEGGSLAEVEKVLEKGLATELSNLETKVAKAEEQFTILRSQYVTAEA